MKYLFLLICALFCLLGLGIGILMIKRPELAIEIQRRFYARINWKIEPVSMPKEIRNTRIMGWLLIVLLTLALLFALVKMPLL